MPEMLFQGWAGIVRTVLVGVLAYAALVVLLRFSGKRTLSKLYSFDLVVTVALGSTLATILLSKDVALAEGVTAFLVLIALQFALTWTSVRWPQVRAIIKNEPRLLVYQGDLLREAMREERVTEDVLREAVRREGVADLNELEAVVLEPDGSFSVVRRLRGDQPAALLDLSGYPGGEA